MYQRAPAGLGPGGPPGGGAGASGEALTSAAVGAAPASANRKGRHLLLLLEGDALSRWVHAADRAAELKRLFDEAVV